jgi:hypothetical protein
MRCRFARVSVTRDLSPLQETSEIVAFEVSQPGPEADVGRIRHLCLEADQAFDGVADGKRLTV